MTDLKTAPRGWASRAKHEGGVKETPITPAPSPRTGEGTKPGWDGPTYYGRGQLKPAPFNVWVVGAYIWIAGLGGSASLLSGLAEVVDSRRFEAVARRGRYIATLAPVLGAPLLIWDLHTPKRFYNMLRVAKPTSPMSIGTWILMAFSGGSMPAAAAQFLADRAPGLGWMRTVARVAHAPAAASGAGLSVYTAGLLSATSTPSWAAVPRSLAVRFGASSVAAGASALLVGERDPSVRRVLQTIAVSGLAVELAAGAVHDATLKDKGVGEAMHTPWGRAERLCATALGAALPLALFGLSLAGGRKADRRLGDLAAVLAIGGSAALKIATLGVGHESASRPEISFRFSRPENLPKET